MLKLGLGFLKASVHNKFEKNISLGLKYESPLLRPVRINWLDDCSDLLDEIIHHIPYTHIDLLFDSGQKGWNFWRLVILII